MLDLQTTAFVFPGQGSQFVGMGRELALASLAARQTFAEADDCLGFALSRLCWDGPDNELTDTLNAQPALLICSIAAVRAWREKWGGGLPAYLAGHSLGEITALVAADALSFTEGVRLVRRRGEAMKTAGAKRPGGMAAIMGLDAPAVVELCAAAAAAAGGLVQVANDNCPGQVVISGELAALDKALELAKARGVKRVVKLPVSIASHSPLMEPAIEEFGRAVAAAPFTAPAAPVIGNVHARPLTKPEEIRVELTAQLVSPVRWTDSVRYLLGQGIKTFIEFGAKDVLTGLLRRIDATAVGVAIGTPESVDKGLP